MPRPLIAEISIPNLRSNFQQIVSSFKAMAINPNTIQTYAVIKANAYGHGVINAVKAFQEAQGLALIELEQAINLRALGWEKNILLLEGFFEQSDLILLEKHNISTIVHNQEQIDMLKVFKADKKIDVFIKINTGMNRLGFLPQQFNQVYKQLHQLEKNNQINIKGYVTHFANADATEDLVSEPWKLLETTVAKYPGVISACNSAASLKYGFLTDPDRINILRPGIALYGSSPMGLKQHETAKDYHLKPTMTLKTKIIAIQQLNPGDTLGYGSLFQANQSMRIAIVACGYADGYPRDAITGTPATVLGKKTQLLGRVSMDMLAIDLSPVPDAKVDDWVVLWGENGPTIDEVADCSNRLAYELMCNLNRRVEVKVIE